MDARLQEMLDHHEIRILLAEYVHGCDRADAAHMGSVYWDDSWDDHGITQAPGPEFARVMTERILTDSDTLSHLLGQSLIKVDGETAGVETYFIAVTTVIAADGTRSCNQLGGRYVDRLERREGQWKVKHRIAMRDWSISLTVEQDSYIRANLTPGQRSQQDPSYAALGIAHSGAA
ncbi:MAG: nuclear transport factor 2 family protein [Novosphingobium sp.]|nr:nuclear transport factor 2 family protein [Novosphingobium sp.]